MEFYLVSVFPVTDWKREKRPPSFIIPFLDSKQENFCFLDTTNLATNLTVISAPLKCVLSNHFYSCYVAAWKRH